MRAGKGDGPLQGNAAVQDLFYRWWQESLKGKLIGAAVTGCEGPDTMQAELSLKMGCEFAINYGLDSLKNRIVQTIVLREPVNNIDPGADFVCYNLNKAPMNWDFIIWLVDREMDRRREGAPAPLKVGFYRSETNDYRPAYCDLMLNRVMRPLLPLIGAVEDERATKGRLIEFYAPRYISEAARKGEPVPILKPSEMARAWADKLLAAGKAPVTITLREAEHFTWRNSDIAAWIKFANYLKQQGERVIFVRDTALADGPIAGFEVNPQASRSVDYRMALYEKARANLFGSNGPQGLAMFSDRPFLSFHQLNQYDNYEANRPQWWTENMGISEGEQFPWFEKGQRFVYKSDTYENLCEEWELLRAELDDAGTGEQHSGSPTHPHAAQS
jgi:hypothetical protein